MAKSRIFPAFLAGLSEASGSTICALGRATHAGMNPSIGVRFAIDGSGNASADDIAALASYLERCHENCKGVANTNSRAYERTLYIRRDGWWDDDGNIYFHDDDVDRFRDSKGAVDWTAWARRIVSMCDDD